MLIYLTLAARSLSLASRRTRNRKCAKPNRKSSSAEKKVASNSVFAPASATAGAKDQFRNQDNQGFQETLKPDTLTEFGFR
jgi:hypothetical protein